MTSYLFIRSVKDSVFSQKERQRLEEEEIWKSSQGSKIKKKRQRLQPLGYVLFWSNIAKKACRNLKRNLHFGNLNMYKKVYNSFIHFQQSQSKMHTCSQLFSTWYSFKIYTLLQGLMLISGTQTGCRRLDSYIEQKKFLACGPEFSAPPEFSGGVTEKYLSTGWARTFDLQITQQILYHCATATLCL